MEVGEHGMSSTNLIRVKHLHDRDKPGILHLSGVTSLDILDDQHDSRDQDYYEDEDLNMDEHQNQDEIVFLQGRLEQASLQEGTPPHKPSPAATSTAADKGPDSINPKQYFRIQKRRMARQRLEEAFQRTAKRRKPDLHGPKTACSVRRPRGPGGRILTAEQLSLMDKGEGSELQKHAVKGQLVISAPRTSNDAST
ncbi:Transcriptional activator [Mycoblastus sanguinarius]|nr:Transcriptional activator [Mycoblastus sanguinarius]